MAAFTAMAIMAGIGLAMDAYGRVKGGQAAKKAGLAEQQAAESGAQLSEYNASVADLQATDAVQRGIEDANRYRSAARQVVGEQRTGFAASGVDVGYGSTVDTQADSTWLGELDALTAKNNAAREAWGYQVEAYDLRQRAAIMRKEGKYAAEAGRDAARAGYIGAATTIAGGTASLLQAKYGYSTGKAPKAPKAPPPPRPSAPTPAGT